MTMVVKDYSMQARDNNSSTGNSCVDNNRDNGKWNMYLQWLTYNII